MAVMDQKWSALPVPYAMELPDRVPKERYYDPDFYAHGGRAVVAPGLADGVPARGDPAAARLRRVRVPRPVGRRGAHRRHGGHRVPERLPPSRREARRGQWNLRAWVPVPVPRVVLRARRHEHRGHAAADVRRAQPGGGRPRPHAGAVRGVGRVRVDQLRRRRPSGAASASSRRRRTSTRGRWSRCAPRSGTRAASR